MTGDYAASGTKYYTLGFVVSQGTCLASWGGSEPVTSGYYSSQIQGIRSAGGDVIVSFGGANGPDLADSCSTLSSLEAQYQSVVSEYKVTHIDFDIEGADIANQTALNLRFAAIAMLEKANPSLSVSVTLPVLPTGLTSSGLNVLDTAMAYGARIDLVNIMAMDYGNYAAPNPAGQMGTYAIDSANATQAQLATLYPGLTTAQLWTMIGVTPMIGVNDQSDEIFTVSNAQQLVTFANSVHLGRLSMWSATRDTECSGGTSTYAEPTCSSIIQQPYAFSSAFNVYTG